MSGKPKALARDPFDGLDAQPVAAPAAGGDAFAGLDAEAPHPAFIDYQPPPPGAAQPKIGTAEALARGAGQGASLGLADEAAGVGAKLAPGDSIPRAAGRGVGAPLSDRTDYDVARDAERAANKQAATDTAFDKRGLNPLLAAVTPDSTFGVGEALGTAATAAVPVGEAAEGATLVARGLKAAKAGAGVGGVAGFGNSEGDAATQVADTATGAAMGGALGPLAAEATRLGSSGTAATRKVLGNAADKLLGRSAEREIEQGGPALARKAELLANPTSPEGQQLRAQATAGGSPDAIDAHTRDIGKKVDELLQHSDVVRWDEDIASKGRAIKSMMEREPVPQGGLTKADATYDAVKKEWDQLASDVGKGEGSATVSRLQREAFDAYEERLKSAADKFDPKDPHAYVAERFMALDNLKRQLQREIARGRVPFDDILRDRMETPLRLELEDGNTWGAGPATLQKVRNAGWTRRLSSSGTPENAFLAANAFGERSADPYHVLAQHDPGKLQGIVRGAGTLPGEQGARALTDWSDREAGLLEALTSHGTADPALAQRAQRARQLANEIKGAMGTRTGEASAAAELERAGGAKPMPPTSMAGRALDALPGARRVADVLRPQPLGERAALLARLEDVRAQNPANRPAALRLRSMGSDVQIPAFSKTLRIDESRVTPAAGVRTGGAGAPSVMPATASEGDKPSGQDLALQDEKYGSVLASKDPQSRAVAVNSLLATDPDFRNRQRERARKHENQSQETP